jgi:hypothetical protein
VLNFVALFIVFGVSKFSGAWKSIQDFFYYYFLLYLVFAWALCLVSLSLILFFRRCCFFFGKILFNVHEKAMQSDFFSPSSYCWSFLFFSWLMIMIFTNWYSFYGMMMVVDELKRIWRLKNLIGNFLVSKIIF